MSDPLYELAHRAGLEPGYTDAFGKPRKASRASVAAALSALGFPVATDAAIRKALTKLKKRQKGRFLEPVALVRAGAKRPEVAIAAPSCARGDLRWRLETEGGEVFEGSVTLAAMSLADDGSRRLALPRLVAGYHTLDVVLGESRERQRVIAAPACCYTPPALRKDGRTWGFGLHVYTLRSARNWGIGDFTDLGELAGLARSLGAGAIAVNPLHANFLDDPEHASPYSPSSRRHFNPLYLDVEAIPDFAECRDARLRMADAAFQAELARLRATDWVDYRGVAAVKRPVLEVLYRHFRASHLDGGLTERGAAFRAFQDTGGRGLWRYCVFHALQERLSAGDANLRDWRCWPPDYRDPSSEAVVEFAAQNVEAVDFHAYLQWQSLAQLDRIRDACADMPVGLISDLALGSDTIGAETWGDRDLFVTGASLGAPPDTLNLLGQDWGLPPMNPVALRERGYDAFIEVLRANMRHAGAIRIDHVPGLMRQYWIPAGFPADDGLYVRFPFEEMLGILALESERQRCLVIGEDLGTVPDGLRERLRAADVLSYRLLYFERDEQGDFPAPDAFPRHALVAATTHDLPTLPAYCTVADLALRKRLGLYPDAATYRTDLEERKADLARLETSLRRQGLATDNDTAVPVAACYAYLARTPSLILQVQIEDLLGQTAPLNVPGTGSEYPNWRRKLRLNLDDLAALPDLHALAAELRRERGAPPEVALPDEVWTPYATYRLQFHAGFSFDAAARLVEYLHDLGVSHVYASPYLRARSGSPHGYDIVDHGTLNPEIGGEAGLYRFVSALACRGMGQVLDFVPNHMGIAQANNPAWLDVLRWGRASTYACFFDIDWQPEAPELQGRVVLPFLGDDYGDVLVAGELVPRFDAGEGSFDVWYHEHCFPVAPGDYAELIDACLADVDPANAATPVRALAEGFRQLRRMASDDPATRRYGEACREALRHLVREEPDAASIMHRAAGVLEGTPDDADSFRALHDLLERQAYRLAFWRAAASEINYRRFFDINELAGIRVEDDAVFDEVHKLVARLVAEGRLHGLRIDHIDGLSDPACYLSRLRQLLRRMRGAGTAAPTPYTVVEKILEPGERLPENWPVEGTTGYEFMNQVLGLFVDPAGQEVLDRTHARFGGDNDFPAVLYRAKRQVIRELFAGELESLVVLLRLSEQGWQTRDFTRPILRTALAEVAARFPVYRTYVSPEHGCSQADRDVITRGCAEAYSNSTASARPVFDFVQAALAGDLAKDVSYDGKAVLEFARRFQQFTGPVMAKSLEDTAFYRHVRLAALNEVGGDPGQFGLTPEAFHAANAHRAKRWPHTMLATATHDNKRGEDVRMRLAALSELAEAWEEEVVRWAHQNAGHTATLPDGPAPSPLDSYLLYQTLVGAWPTALLDCDLASATQELATFAERIQAYMVKAVREAKLRSSWLSPNAAYEAAVSDFVARLLDPAESLGFLTELQEFSRRVGWLGALNSLGQTVLKLTSPGMPDIYQGAELWDFALVDPDNRRPVDFDRRAAFLSELRGDGTPDLDTVAELLAAWPDGRIKMHVLQRLLHLRRDWPALFGDSGYEPLDAAGPEAGRVIVFRRGIADRQLIVVVGRLLAPLYDRDGRCHWGTTAVHVEARTPLYDVLTGRRLVPGPSGSLPVKRLFEILPCSVLVGDL
ncbi:malto-oligosyltrehalose synthase [Ferruginivarius sediminum]|uniref:4-alpha-glucanotransferase n=1 Tax=Ferruginivarius sediminum TaxID=2661937 RepID=A0A369TER5_9PROT|nr:malto-oligosyltrehalose synthase [Ferruginivarius sediminum]RDD63803.1 malto-oligosyltrehalose synthase [Ferruginivarius sediminum]